jgi:NADH:ubiquinone oxidoreductase subunit E
VNELRSKYPQEIEQILSKYPPEKKQSAAIPLLFLAQREEDAVSRAALAEIAEIINVSVTEVASLVGFYTLFHQVDGDGAAPRYRIQVCTDLPCALRGSETFLEELCERMGVQPGETTEDGLFAVEAVMCLAACDKAPMFQLQGDGEIAYHEEQTVEKTLELVESLRQAHKEVK